MTAVDVEQRAMLEQAFAVIPTGIVICEQTNETDLTIVQCNPAFERISGYALEELNGRLLAMLEGPETEAGAREEVQAAIRAGHAVEVDVRHYRKDGAPFWSHLSLSPVAEAEGIPAHWAAAVNDVTKQKQAQERLQRSEWLLSEAQAMARIGSFDWNFAESTALWSEEMYRVLGVDPGTEPTETTLRERVVPEDRAKIQALTSGAGEHSPHVTLDLQVVHPGGAHRVVQLRGFAFRDANGQLLRMVGTVQDVTESRAAEAVLRDSEKRKAGIMDSALDAVLTIDEEGRIVDCNLAAGQIFRATNGDLVGDELSKYLVIHRELNGSVPKVAEALGMHSERGERVEVLGRRADGQVFPAELTLTRVPHPGPTLYTGFIRDITERKRAEDEAREQAEEELDHQRALVELASREKSDFPSTLEAIIKADSDVIQAERISFWSFRENMIYCEMLYRRSRNSWEFGAELTEEDYPTYFKALRANAVIDAHDAQTDPRTFEFKDEYLGPNAVTSLLDVPVWRGGELAGVICHEHVGPAREWSVEEMKFANSIGHMIALALAERERQQAESALRESEERFRATFEHAAVGIGHLSLDGRFTWVNPRFCDILGYSQEDVLAIRWTDFSDASQPEEPLLGVPKLLNGELDVYKVDRRFTRGNGSTIWLHVTNSVKRDAQGRALYMIPVIQDISDRTHAEERVLQQASLLDLTHDAIIARDLDDRIVFWNHGAERLYSVSAAEAIGQREDQLLYADAWDFDNAKREVLSKGEWHGELRQQVPNGKEVVVDARWTLVLDELGRPSSILAINTDITGRKALEEQFLRAQRMESIGTLASGVAHDLNNILAPILMAVPMLRSDVPDQIRDSLVGTIEASAQRGADIVRQVLTFARGVEGERVLLQPYHLLREMEKISTETFPKTITIRNRTPRDLWPVIGDATQLHQVLLNLCVNARDAMIDGGTLTIEAENFRMDESYAAMMPEAQVGPWVILKVSDTGCGIPREAVEKIFDPFFTTKEPGKGTGLGLSTVVGIVRSHGGFIKVFSEVGRGTVFKVYIPAVVDGILEQPVEAAPEMPIGQGELILVVDDEAGVREVTEAVLRRHNYQVLLAADGTEALALYAQRQNEISVVVTDVVMPFIDGVALTRALKRLNPDVKVIAATGHAQNNRTAELKTLDIHSFLLKPFSAEALLQEVSGALKPRLEG